MHSSMTLTLNSVELFSGFLALFTGRKISITQANYYRETYQESNLTAKLTTFMASRHISQYMKPNSTYVTQTVQKYNPAEPIGEEEKTMQAGVSTLAKQRQPLTHNQQTESMNSHDKQADMRQTLRT